MILSALSIYGFYTYYVSDVNDVITLKQTRITGLRAVINKGVATARRLGEFQSQVTDLEHRLDALKNVLPEQKDVADTLRRIQGLATQSNLTLLRFTPAAPKQQPLYLEVPHQLIADGNYHNLALFFDRVAKFQRIINVGDISIGAKPRQDPNSTITRDADRDHVRPAGSCHQGRPRRAAAGSMIAMRPTLNRANAQRSRSFAALAASSAYGQVPNPAAAINAAKDARAKTEAADKKNSDALDPPSGAGRRGPRRPGRLLPQGAAASTGATGATGAAAAPSAGSAAGYTYDPSGRRDPFVSLLGRGGDVAGGRGGARPAGAAGAC